MDHRRTSFSLYLSGKPAHEHFVPLAIPCFPFVSLDMPCSISPYSLLSLQSESAENCDDNRDNSTGFAHVFDRTVNFNELQKSIVLQKHSQQSEFINEEQAMSDPSKIPRPKLVGQSRQRLHNLKLISHNIYQIVSQGGVVHCKDICKALLTGVPVETTSSVLQRTLAPEDSRYSVSEIEMSSQLKNIRRRLYDAINVLAAVDVLQKSKSWLTLANSQLCESLSTGTCTQKNNEVVQLLEETTNRIKQKRKRIQQLAKNYLLLHKLISRNLYASEFSRAFTFPLLVAPIESACQVTIEMERISIKAEQMLRFHAGEDMLGYLFTTTHNEVELVMQGSVQVKEEE